MRRKSPRPPWRRTMRAAVLEAYREPLVVRDCSDPAPPDAGVVIEVGACGICRSDWHMWVGDWDALMELPRIPGHEFGRTRQQRGQQGRTRAALRHAIPSIREVRGAG